MRPALFVFLVAMAGALRAQAPLDDVLVYGTVKHYVTSVPMEGAWVVVQRDGVKADQLVTDSAGRYEVHLAYDHVYTLFYMDAGKVSKHVRIDLKGIPPPVRVGGHGMNVDVTLFPAYPCLEVPELEQPIGLACYDPADSLISWDIAYTEGIRRAIGRSMQRYDSLRTGGGCP
jgi:hypothetical protein